MASREPEPDDPTSSGRRGTDEYPLLFKGHSRPSRPGLVARTLDRILAFFRESPGDRRVTASPPPPAPKATAAHGPQRGEGPEDAPDGRTDQPAPLGRPRQEVSFGSPEGEEEIDGDADEDRENDENGDEEGDEDEAGGGDENEAGDEEEEAEDEPPAATPIHRATLQMLPGRLVPVEGGVGRQEIRFMRPSNPGQEVTIGWERGAPPDHVTIDHPSVQMRHAGMSYRRGQWWIQSLSNDPPVLLNGRPIGPEGGPRHLKDGDLVRLGDLDFRFRMP